MEILENKEILQKKFGHIIDIKSLSDADIDYILSNPYYLDKSTIDKAMNGNLISMSGFSIPTFNSLNNLTIYIINRIKDNLRTTEETNDLMSQAWIGYIYTVKKCIIKDDKAPIKKFENYYSTWLTTELLRYIKTNCLLIKTQAKDAKMKIGDDSTNSVALSKVEQTMISDDDEHTIYIKDIVSSMVNSLEEDEMTLIKLKYGLDGVNLNVVEICEILSINKIQYNSILQSAMLKMKVYSAKNNITKEIIFDK